MLLPQRKYSMDLLQKASILGCKPVSKSMEVDVDLWSEEIKVYDDVM